ncbi:MAG TPA: hypothetical protein VM677_03365 [Actinokineospora sp.]|nr:hypothetical protein [Actinokineospora sp.]
MTEGRPGLPARGCPLVWGVCPRGVGGRPVASPDTEELPGRAGAPGAAPFEAAPEPLTDGDPDGRAAFPDDEAPAGDPPPRCTVGPEPLVSMRPIFDAADWSEPRVAWAVALVFDPALSAAFAAWSALVRALAMASSARFIATWPKTPALLLLAPMFSFAPTPSRSWLPRLAIRPPSDSTESGFIPTRPVEPEPPDPVAPADDPPWDDDGDEWCLRLTIRPWRAASRTAGPRRRRSSRSRRTPRTGRGP